MDPCQAVEKPWLPGTAPFPPPPLELTPPGGGLQALTHPRVQAPISGIHAPLSRLRLPPCSAHSCGSTAPKPVCTLGAAGRREQSQWLLEARDKPERQGPFAVS